ncbi:DNA repair protein RecN [Mesonia maritima]|uniref:DNA repair protein RecN n=1 Tax=Mesonia maritima TaxID=1793873 RepID=A0ABU1K3X6_9FLAO|nr:DNA repair protein RecN [Mesonia maritima]MDR6300319.1 DNA repair protein RecN (Recombination protein N) [Mesonia maritima]
MLTSLTIKNFALIEDVHIQLKNGFTTITGETGAGKSILLGALSLLLGKRADLSAIRNSAKKCIVEGIFSIEDYKLQKLFDKEELDYEDQTIIRREILPSGKSRAFINDTPVTLQKLGVLGNQLVDIHSQHETLFIGDSNYQYSVIDALAETEELLKNYKSSYKNHLQLQKKLENLKQEQQEVAATYDYNLFLLKELEEAQLVEGMQEELEAESQALNNVELLKENLSAVVFNLQQEEIGALERIQEIKSRLQAIEDFGEKYASLFERIQSVLVELEDISVEAERLQDNVEDDPERLEYINEKLQKLYNIQKKHQTDSVSELLEIQQDLQEKVEASENSEENLERIQQEISEAKKEVLLKGKNLFEKRKKAIPTFIKQIEAILKELGMPEARLKIELELSENFTSLGTDEMEWKLAANKGGNFSSLKKAASGGELSRITLAIKSILASYSQLPTIIFDEIDTGVSGEIAQKMGNIMSEMGKDLQVIAITHLPQIAAKGNQHLKVYKKAGTEATTTNILTLEEKDRIQELAEMLGGKQNSDSAIAHAKALLN